MGLAPYRAGAMQDALRRAVDDKQTLYEGCLKYIYIFNDFFGAAILIQQAELPRAMLHPMNDDLSPGCSAAIPVPC